MGTVSELVEELHALALSEQGRGDLAAASVIHMIAGLVAERRSVSDDRIALIEATIRSEAINARARGDVYRAAGLDEAAGIVDAVTESVDAGTIGDDSNAREGSQG